MAIKNKVVGRCLKDADPSAFFRLKFCTRKKSRAVEVGGSVAATDVGVRREARTSERRDPGGKPCPISRRQYRVPPAATCVT